MRTLWIVIVAGLLGACGSPDQQESSGAASSGRFDRVFRDNVRQRFVDRCIAGGRSARRNGTADYAPFCRCSAERLTAGKPIRDLAIPPRPAERRSVAAYCAGRHPIAPF